jgi:hypothetical protein
MSYTVTENDHLRTIVTLNEVKDFILTLFYNEGAGGDILKGEFDNATHLIRAETALEILLFLIRAQRSGLQLAFIDPYKLSLANIQDVFGESNYEISTLMYPGYSDVYKSDFEHLDYTVEDSIANSCFLEDIMKHFGRDSEYKNRAIEIDTLGDIVEFINSPIIRIEKKKNPYLNALISCLFFLYKYKITVSILGVFLTYWLLTDLKAAFITSGMTVIGVVSYKCFKQFQKDIKP